MNMEQEWDAFETGQTVGLDEEKLLDDLLLPLHRRQPEPPPSSSPSHADRPQASRTLAAWTPQVFTLVERVARAGILDEEEAARLASLSERDGGSYLRLLAGQSAATGEPEEEPLLKLASELMGLERAVGFPDARGLEWLSGVTARELRCVPVRREGDVLVLAMETPSDLEGLDRVECETGLAVRPLLASPAGIDAGLALYDGRGSDLLDVLGSFGPEEDAHDIRLLDDEDETVAGVEDAAPIIRLVNVVIAQAVHARASDIHIEPGEDQVRVRFRVDGILHEAIAPPKRIHAPLVSRIKVMGNMDIGERRKPQDGHIRLSVQGRPMELRVSTVPGLHGEKVVMRLLDRAGMTLGLEQLGFDGRNLEVYQSLLERPHGVVLITGPTGSGKTTTLYSTLARLNGHKRNILTIEDPVEYELPGITQIQVNTRAGVTFANGLRAFLRQDPDVIMVGETRDEETAEMAIRAALTGHQVFTTLHTNDAPSALTRLVDMNIPPYLLASAVAGVGAQRLARTLCKDCREPYQATEADWFELGMNGRLTRPEGDLELFRAHGCDHCNDTGYMGRTVLLEVMPMSESIRTAVMQRASAAELRSIALMEGMQCIFEHGVNQVLRGRTSAAELLRVMQSS